MPNHEFNLAIFQAGSSLWSVGYKGYDRSGILLTVSDVNVGIDGVVVARDGLRDVQCPSGTKISPAQQGLAAVGIGIEATPARYLCRHSTDNLLSNSVPDFILFFFFFIFEIEFFRHVAATVKNWKNIPDGDRSHGPLNLHITLAFVDAHHLAGPVAELLINFTYQGTL